MNEPMLLFPQVLRQLEYDRNLGARDRRSVRLSIDAAINLLIAYSKDMYQGIAFDNQIRQQWNLADPHSICAENLNAARLIHAQGFSNSTFDTFLGQPFRGLVDIPADADLFTTTRFDRPAAIALAILDDLRGIATANSTKILHQKRPGLIPILDEFVRRALNLTWNEHEGIPGYLRHFERYRAFRDVGENRAALDTIIARLPSSEARHFADKPLVRIVDALAWSLIYYRDPFRSSAPTT